VWPATPEVIGAARTDVVERAREAGVRQGMLDDIRLAVSEACANAVLHAWVTGTQAAEAFATSTATDDGHFEVWVADEGRGATPATPNSGAGLGLSLMEQLSQRLELGVLPEGGTQVYMRFALA
jgi:anti-sigma regulatory factor (Ser/Thr protein kinase)